MQTLLPAGTTRAGPHPTVFFGGSDPADPPPAKYDSAGPPSQRRPLRGRPTAKRRGPSSSTPRNHVTCVLAGELG